VILAFFIFLTIFISAVLISEYKNIETLKTEEHLIPTSDDAISYRKTNISLWAFNLFLGFLIPTLFLVTGLSRKLMDITEGTFRSRFLSIGAFALIYFSISFLIKLPLRYYSSFIIAHRFGMSNQTIGRWLSNVFK